MFLTAFYSPLLPLGLAYSLVGLLINYWMQKRMLLRRRTVSNSLNTALSLEMTNALELFLPILCFGNLIFITMIANPEAELAINNSEQQYGFFWSLVQLFLSSSYLNKVGVFIGLIHYCLPSQRINKLVFPVYDKYENTESFQEALAKYFPRDVNIL